jgi:TetR/AcrR family transcriptional regulator, mexJK operon transcriptional repressor
MLAMNKPAGRPRAADLEARNENLINMAAQLFLKLGYGKVSLELIAREAHVAVRTIYVKFGGKAGLFKAVLIANRDKFIAPQQMEIDPRPFKEVIDEFSEHFLDMICAPEAIEVQRMVIAEAKTDPEVAHSFFEAGPRQSREMLSRYFERPDVRAQLRDGIDFTQLPSFLLNCVVGDFFSRFLFTSTGEQHDEVVRKLHKRLAMFYSSVLKTT